MPVPVVDTAPEAGIAPRETGIAPSETGIALREQRSTAEVAPPLVPLDFEESTAPTFRLERHPPAAGSLDSGEGSEDTAGEGSPNTAGAGSEDTAGEGSPNTAGEGSEDTAGEGSEDTAGEGSEDTAGEGSPNTAGAGSPNTTEPDTLTNREAAQPEFLEARSTSIVPRFELRAPVVENAAWAESSPGTTGGAPFHQSGASIGVIFHESPGSLSFEVGSAHENRPWVSAVDEQRWRVGTEALALVGISPQAVGFPIMFGGPRDQKKGTTFTVERRIEVYIADGDSVRDVAHVIAHEFGHAIDVSWNSPQDRYRWLAARGLPNTTPWWPLGGVSDLTTGAGDFAECFASWRVSVASRSALAGSCEAQFTFLAELWDRER